MIVPSITLQSLKLISSPLPRRWKANESGASLNWRNGNAVCWAMCSVSLWMVLNYRIGDEISNLIMLLCQLSLPSSLNDYREKLELALQLLCSWVTYSFISRLPCLWLALNSCCAGKSMFLINSLNATVRFS